MSATPSTSTHTEALETTLVSGVSDTCSNCGTRLASEQRYCIECGERRGQSRLPFADALSKRTQAAAAPPRPPRRPRLTANGALIAGVGTLILALGVGVLIGRSGNNSGSAKSAAAPVVRVVGGAGAAAAAGNAAASGSGGSAGGKAKKAAKGGNSNGKVPISKQTVQKKGSNVPPPAVKIGSPGHGRGYKNGKFTGDFFGQ